MRESDDLFQLIKSLTKNEKGYFKKYSSLHTIGEQNKYIALFDAIEKQKVYDEHVIRKEFAKERFVKQLHVAKNYLYNLLLQSIEQYHDNINIQLRSCLNQAEILLDKQLYRQSEKLIHKGKQLAQKYEKHTLLLDFLFLENRLVRRFAYKTKSKEELENTFKNEFTVIETYKNIIEYRRLNAQLFVHINQVALFRGNAEREKFKKIIQNPLFSSEQKVGSFKALSLYYLGNGAYHNTLKLHKKALVFSEGLVKAYENNPQFIEENFVEYHTAVKNTISCLINMREYTQIYPHLEKLKTINIRSNHLRNETFYFTHYVRMVVEINLGKFQEGVIHLKQIQKEIKENEFIYDRINDEILFDYCFAYIYFGAGNYQKANHHLYKIINDPGNNRNDVYCFSKLLNIIIHFEKGELDLLEYSVKSMYRYLSKKEALFKFERLLLHFLQKGIRNINSHKELMEAFKKLRDELKEIVKDPAEKSAMETFDLISWVESKIQNKTFADLVKANNGE